MIIIITTVTNDLTGTIWYFTALSSANLGAGVDWMSEKRSLREDAFVHSESLWKNQMLFSMVHLEIRMSRSHTVTMPM